MEILSNVSNTFTVQCSIFWCLVNRAGSRDKLLCQEKQEHTVITFVCKACTESCKQQTAANKKDDYNNFFVSQLHQLILELATSKLRI